MRFTKIKENHNPDCLSFSFRICGFFTMIGLPGKVHHRSRLVTIPTMTVTLGFLLAMFFVVQLIREKEAFGQELGVENSHSLVFSKDSRNSSGSSTTIAFTRKLLQSPGDDGNRIGTTCSKNDIVIFQGSAAPLPNGIPSYSVQILNVCVSGCSISNIHVSCGWFSTVRLINPRVFRRVYYDDCLVNDGQALGPGESLSFEYANSYSYPLSVSSVFCS